MLFSGKILAQILNGCWKDGRETSVDGVYTDTRRSGTGKLFVALAGEKFDAHNFLDKAVQSGAAALCVRCGAAVPENIPVIEVEDTLKAYQALGAYQKSTILNLKTFAVTGSVGKTSVKEMLRAITGSVSSPENVLATEGNTNNHVGVPQNLLKLEEHHKFAVIEMGMSHAGEILPLTLAAKPDIAIVNSIAPCHIEHLGSLEGIAIEKGTIFRGLPSDGIAVIPAGLEQTALLEKAAEGRKILYFGTTENCDVRADYCGGRLDGSSFKLTFKGIGTFEINWSLSGRHQAVNASAAAAAAWGMGIAPEQICAALPLTVLPGMRSKITRLNDVTYINDAYNANPASMAAALDYLEESAGKSPLLLLLLGAMLELGEKSSSAHEELLKTACARFPQAQIFTFGKPFADAAEKYGVRFFEHPADAAEEVLSAVGAGSIVFAKGSRGIGVENALPAEAR